MKAPVMEVPVNGSSVMKAPVMKAEIVVMVLLLDSGCAVYMSWAHQSRTCSRNALTPWSYSQLAEPCHRSIAPQRPISGHYAMLDEIIALTVNKEVILCLYRGSAHRLMFLS
jgi:hypothetical protein